MESQKNTATNLERISGDYKQMKEENNALAKKLKSAKWVNRKLFYTNRYFLMNNASRNKEFDWSDIFCCLLSLLFLFESLMNPLLHGPMAIHVQNLDVRATRKSSNVTVYVAIAVTALFWVFWPIIKSPDVVTGGYMTPPPWPRIPKRTYLQTKVSSVWKRDRDVSPPLPKNTPHKKGSL